MMEKLSPDILIEAYGLLLNEVSNSGTQEELEAVMKYAQKAVMRQLAPKMLEMEEETKGRIDQRERENWVKKADDQKSVFNLFNAPVGQAMSRVDKVESKMTADG